MAILAAQAEAEAAEKKSKKGDAKGKKKKKGKKGDAGVVEEVQSASHKIGPNELVRKFDDYYDDFTNKWAIRDETDN